MSPLRCCYAARCIARVAPQFLMCTRHWLLLPRKLQTEVWEARRDMERMFPGSTKAYILAIARAQLAVASREGLTDVAAEIEQRVAQMEKGKL